MGKGLFTRWLRSKSRRQRSVDAEIEHHLELRTRDLVETGMEPGAARREAERRFGDVAAARRTLYAAARRSDGHLLMLLVGRSFLVCLGRLIWLRCRLFLMRHLLLRCLLLLLCMWP